MAVKLLNMASNKSVAFIRIIPITGKQASFASSQACNRLPALLPWPLYSLTKKLPIGATSCRNPSLILLVNKIYSDIANIVVDDTIILELKTVRRIIATHKVQIVNYLVTNGTLYLSVTSDAENAIKKKKQLKKWRKSRLTLSPMPVIGGD